MKANIESLTPILLSELRNRNHEVGYTDREDGDHYESNYLWLEKDGWSVELSYSLCAKWLTSDCDYCTPSSEDITCAWGNIDELTIVYVNPENGEETEFEKEDLEELCFQILETIKETIL